MALPEPPSASAAQEGSWLRGSLAALAACGILAAGAGIATLACLALGWSSVVRAGVATDLTEYVTAIHESDLEPADRDALVERLDRLREKARSRSLPFFKWIDYDESIRSLVDDRQITATELGLLTREIERLEKELE